MRVPRGFGRSPFSFFSRFSRSVREVWRTGLPHLLDRGMISLMPGKLWEAAPALPPHGFSEPDIYLLRGTEIIFPLRLSFARSVGSAENI